MGPVRLVDIRYAAACREFRFRARNKATEYRLVRQGGKTLDKKDLRFDLFANDKKVRTLMEREMLWGRASNVSAEIDNERLDLTVIDLGDETGSGAGFTIMNILAKIAQERNAGLSLLSLANMGLLHIFGRISDFRLRASAYKLLKNISSLYVAPERMVPRARFVFVPDGDSQYVCVDDRVAAITFSYKGPKMVTRIKRAKRPRFSPGIRIGTKFSDLTFNLDGTLSVAGKKAGYPVFFQPSIEIVVGMDPKPVDSVIVEVD